MLGRGLFVVRAGLAACLAVNAVHVRKRDVSDVSDPCNDALTGLRCCRPQANRETTELHSGPMIVWTHGCARSSAVMFMLKQLSEKSGRPALDCGRGFELLADISKGFYAIKDDPNKAFHSFVKRAALFNRGLLFKGETKYAIKDPNLMSDLAALQAKIVPMKRQNALDVALCSVHDCFSGWLPTSFGYPIDESGNKSDNCAFRNRNTSVSNVLENAQIFVDTEHLLQNLNKITSDQGASEIFLKRHGYNFSDSETSEDLFAFTTGSEGLETSVESWTRLVKSLGIPIGKLEVEEYLRQNTRDIKPERRHSEMIYNYKEVKEVLRNCVLQAKERRRNGNDFRGPRWCDRIMSMLRE